MMMFYVSPEKHHKIKAFLLIAILSAAKGRRVSSNILDRKLFEPGTFSRNAESSQKLQELVAHLIFQGTDGRHMLDASSLAEVTRSSSKTSFVPPAWRRQGGTASGASTRLPAPAKGFRIPSLVGALPRRAKGAEMSVAEDNNNNPNSSRQASDLDGSELGCRQRRASADEVQLSAAAAAAPEEGVLAQYQAENEALRLRVAELEQLMADTEGLCEVLDDGGGWTSSVRVRASWLLGLLACQSASSFVLADNEALLINHPTVIFFMTMLVGAGGNAGNQASVRIIRGLATGEVDARPTERTTALVSDEIKRAAVLASILFVAGFLRVAIFDATIADATAISVSLFLIVSTSVVLGTLLPLLLQNLKVDAANASTTIQVIMDVLGVLITCKVAPLVFDSPFFGS